MLEGVWRLRGLLRFEGALRPYDRAITESVPGKRGINLSEALAYLLNSFSNPKTLILDFCRPQASSYFEEHVIFVPD